MMEKLPALKEWASAIEALGEGRQVIIMRKGGIREETREFRVESDSFYLFPAYEHQRRELLKESERERIDRTVAEWNPHSETVELRYLARITRDIEITEDEQLAALTPYHIWTEDYAFKRLHWKKTKPLHVLFLRIYRMAPPVTLPLKPSYFGCKSWIRPDGIEAGANAPGHEAMPDSAPEMEPVLTSGTYARMEAQICDRLASLC